MPDPAAPSSDAELRTHVERVLAAHYELDCEIGRGGMGIVYRARDRRLKRVVAIKVLPPELAFRSEIRSRFLREAETAASLSHPNIVPIYSVDEAEGLVFFVMAYISGDNLAKRLHEHGVMSAEEVRRILCDVADALDYAHDRGVVHRDIKPDNILLDAESGRPMVTDFGIARAVTEGGDSRLTATGMAIGTPAYMSPEQAAGEREIDGRSDLYSLGVVAYQMLVGEPPFTASSTPAMLVKVISERPTPIDQRRKDLPQDLGRAIMMCLEKDPAMRFDSASALVEALSTGVLPAYPSMSARPRESDPGRALTAAPPAYLPASGLYGGTFDYPLPAYQPSLEEQSRYNHPLVVDFRKKIGPYLFVNAIIVIAAILGDSDFFTITVLWSIYIAYRYARIWQEGYDWRDVFRQPRDKELMEVADEGIDSMRAVFDREKRQELREKRRERLLAEREAAVRRSAAAPIPQYVSPGQGAQGFEPSRARPYPSTPTGSLPRGGAMPPAASPGASAAPAGAPGLDAYARDRIVQAKNQVDDIYRMVDQLPKDQRELVKPDPKESALALAEKVRLLTIQLAEIEQVIGSGEQARIEAQIAQFEAQANPLEPGSETRIRQLVALRRARRAIDEKASRRPTVLRQLEECELALGTIRSHLARLVSSPGYVKASDPSYLQVTQLVERALSVAESVEGARHAIDEVGRVTSRPPGGR